MIPPLSSVTRGHGYLEGFLARQRCRRADTLISPEHRSGRLLDIGCGTFPLFLTRCSFASKYGLDKVVANGDRNGIDEDLRLLNFDVEREDRLPFEDEYFDVVTALAVFEHIEPDRLVQLTSEIRRVLKPKGQYVMTTPSSWTGGILKTMARLRLVSSEEIDEHKDAYSRAQILGVLKRAGFPPDMTRSGHFELFMNTWVVAAK
jgi:SAM-dependent methyltransferase